MLPSPISRPDTLVGVDALIRADFETFSDLWFARLIWSSVIVGIGIFFEGPEVFHEVAGVVRGVLHICKPEKDKKSAVVLCGLIGWLLVAGGVAGEGLCEGFIWKADGILRSFNNMLVAEATKEADNAVLGAATANIKIAEAKRQSAKLEKEAAQLRKDAASIEAKVAWRHLTKKQQADIGAKLGNFNDAEGASLWYSQGDTEAAMFASDIAEALKAAHIVVQPPAEISLMHAAGRFGDPIRHIDTGVILQSTKDELSRSLVDTIILELTSRGFDAIRQKDPPFDDRPIPQVWVSVEPRPEGPQGEYKLQAERKATAKKK